jgi:hypothetical protein
LCLINRAVILNRKGGRRSQSLLAPQALHGQLLSFLAAFFKNAGCFAPAAPLLSMAVPAFYSAGLPALDWHFFNQQTGQVPVRPLPCVAFAGEHRVPSTPISGMARPAISSSVDTRLPPSLSMIGCFYGSGGVLPLSSARVLGRHWGWFSCR